MAKLDDELSEQIQELCDLGIDLADGGRFDKALEAYDMAWDLLPEPKIEWEDAHWILGNMGEAWFLQGEFATGRDVLERAMECRGAVGAGFLHLRLGQCFFELGELDRAKEELTIALTHEAETIFVDEDPKYLALVMDGERNGE